MRRRSKLRRLRWMWLLLLPLPSAVGYAESGDPLATMSVIANRAAKADRLPVAHPPETAWRSCGPARSRGAAGGCAGVAAKD